MTDKIIEIREGVLAPDGMPPPDQAPVEIKLGMAACTHPQVVLDTETRKATCRRCAAVVDPFDHLLALGREWGRCAAWVRHALRKRVELDKQITALKRQEKNLKARIRRARQTVATQEDSP